MKLRTNDTVMVLRGKDRGKTGKILRAYPDTSRVLVEKINVVKKHLKGTASAPHGGIKETELPILSAKVMIVCPHCSKATRVGKKHTDDGRLVRVCKKCHATID